MKFGVFIRNLNLRLGTVHKLKKTHLQFCKRHLEVSNKASNIACRAELGRFPLNIALSQRMLNYILYLKNKNEDSFFKQSFLMSLGLHSTGKNSFHSNLMKMSEYFNLNNFNPDLLDTAKIKHFVSSMKQKSNQIEDKIHFLFYCSKYSRMRDNFFNKIQTLIPNIRHLPVNYLIID